MKRAIAISLVVLAGVGLAIAGFRRAYVLRLRDATDLRISFAAPSSAVISGGMTHSGMTVVGSSVRRANRKIVVRVFIDSIRGRSGIGSYRIPVTIPPNVDEIWFGDSPEWVTVGRFFNYEIRVPRFPSAADDGSRIWQRGRPLGSAAP